MSYLTQLQDTLVARAAQPEPLDPLTRSDREEALANWIEARGVEDDWRLAPALVSAGVDAEQLEAIAQRSSYSGRLRRSSDTGGPG